MCTQKRDTTRPLFVSSREIQSYIALVYASYVITDLGKSCEDLVVMFQATYHKDIRSLE
jgi:hypothetical protein